MDTSIKQHTTNKKQNPAVSRLHGFQKCSHCL